VSQRPEFRRPNAEFQSLRAIQAEATQDFSGDTPFLTLSPGSKAAQNCERCHGNDWPCVSYAHVASRSGLWVRHSCALYSHAAILEKCRKLVREVKFYVASLTNHSQGKHLFFNEL